MLYKDFKGLKISNLGFGLMRLPVINGDQSNIDYDQVKAMVLKAVDAGVTYFDTAFPYHNGKSEETIGRIMEEEGLQDKIHVASKLFTLDIGKPGFSPENMLNTQLGRLRRDNIEFYLMHGLHGDQWQKLKDDYDIINWINNKKAEGKLKFVGFSFHDNIDCFKKIIDDYDWDFVQIQYNYLDRNIQAGDEGLAYAEAKGIPVIVMEPVKGGNLVLPDYPEVEKIKEKYGLSAMSNPELALRFVFDKAAVMTTLSGMSNMAQLEENIRIASGAEVGCFSEAELKCTEEITEFLNGIESIPCTTCRYCTEGCPMKINIPFIFSLYNSAVRFNNKAAQIRSYERMSNIKDCMECGACMDACPQHLEIPTLLRKVREYFEK